MYRYDLHVHTSEVSPCGHLTTEETVRQYIRKGYAGIWITNHFHCEFEEKTRGMSWKEAADLFLWPYREGKKLAEGKLLTGLGMEIRFRTDPNDYLLYGLTEEMVCREAEHWIDMDLEQFYHTYGDRLLIIQAHPSRKNSSVPADPAWLHGMEAVNTSPRHDNGNENTQKILVCHPWLIPSGGSDCHRTEDVGRGGILMEERIRTEEELPERLKGRRYTLICPEKSESGRSGNV